MTFLQQEFIWHPGTDHTCDTVCMNPAEEMSNLCTSSLSGIGDSRMRSVRRDWEASVCIPATASNKLSLFCLPRRRLWREMVIVNKNSTFDKPFYKIKGWVMVQQQLDNYEKAFHFLKWHHLRQYCFQRRLTPSSALHEVSFTIQFDILVVFKFPVPYRIWFGFGFNLEYRQPNETIITSWLIIILKYTLIEVA